ncbi:DUF3533 domain-containing protein [Kitasatospora sp. DSM 101779]|uniref:DUF3533 domain-containing protein n=1 Tax=Kitasatospora sp. DSM 101779 TaxID=2853165 RepID=UPI0021D8E700|nr:DUF3533 domain-containing protein [Kitasatospora sp. DSM 101779]MCU7822877.1 DUF3533 domain-containing protein [Kitasatospora sp. DSM 101779]
MAGPRPGFLTEVEDAVTPRAFLLVLGVLLLQLGFTASYVGALHDPTPHRLSIAVVGPAQAVLQGTSALHDVPDEAVRPSTAEDRESAVRLIEDQKVYAAWLIDPTTSRDTLLVATARGPAAATAAERIVGSLESARHRTLGTEDVLPLAPGDAEGLSSFYLVVGWCVGGYLVASILGISAGSRPANTDRALLRLGTLLLYSLAAGLGGALITGPVLDALPGSVWPLWGLGTLVVFAVGAFTMAMQCLFGVVGIGIAVLIFVVLGNPSAGGVYPPPLLPPFWRAIGSWIPNGAGTDAARSIAYLGGTVLAPPFLVLAAWAVAGVAITLLTADRAGETQPEAAP